MQNKIINVDINGGDGWATGRCVGNTKGGLTLVLHSRGCIRRRCGGYCLEPVCRAAKPWGTAT